MERRRPCNGKLACLFGAFKVLICAEAGAFPLDPPVAPPPDQFSADCSRPVYATDQLVCKSADLLALDTEMLRLWQAARTLPQASGFWIEPQGQWFRRRSMCAFKSEHASCVMAAYSERITVLYMLQLPLGTSGQKVDCTGAGPFRSGSVAFAPKGILFTDGEAQLSIVAMTSISVDWTPFAIAHTDSGSIRIVRLDGAVMNCI